MKSIVLDSAPTVPLRIPSEVRFNVSPNYQGRKLRGQPLLGGQSPFKYTHFVPMGDMSPSIKKLLEIPESDTSPLKPIEGHQEILKEEKANKTKAAAPENVVDSNFKSEAQSFLNKPITPSEHTLSTDPESAQVLANNTANLANLVAATQPAAKQKSKPMTKAKSRPKPQAKPSKKIKKKKTVTRPKKMSSFRIIQKTRK